MKPAERSNGKQINQESVVLPEGLKAVRGQLLPATPATQGSHAPHRQAPEGAIGSQARPPSSRLACHVHGLLASLASSPLLKRPHSSLGHTFSFGFWLGCLPSGYSLFLSSVLCSPRWSFTAAASLVSLAWALASYQKALRDSRDDKKPISYMAVVIQFCWHFFTIAARVITFALFASVFQLYFGIFIVLHWCIMTFWIVHCETEFCITKWEEIVFDMVVGIIYIFSWFNVKEGRTRCRLFIYYFVILLENTALSALWYLYKAPQIADAFAIPALCVVFSSFLTGVVFMLMYYAFFHPNGPRLGRSPSCACGDPAAAFTPSPEAATSALRSLSNTRSVAGDRDQKFAERDGCVPVFQVRPTAPSTPSSRPPRIEESVIKIDLFRNRYPAWERHVLDRSLRKAILAFEGSPSPPRLQYKDDAFVQERLEYETTL
ncbi:hypothetical protein J1605_001912 [Eschrichtius robustus]|uniref:XK-related protein n=1 Tax=Eschrichtius robustus TaxID=9764 RepID=A0AB34HW82_ESCRO|nr:hypothetical protein J1605_001912 [Eschrichtius robustus]